jgi:hypothetical protein
MPHANTFTCAVCQQTFPQTDAAVQAAEAEAATLWGVHGASHKAHMAVLCDACFQRRTPGDIAAMAREYQTVMDGLAGGLLEEVSHPVPPGWWDTAVLTPEAIHALQEAVRLLPRPPGLGPPGSTFDLTSDKDRTD